MKKITRKSLDELAKTMPVLNEIDQRRFVGGGDGSTINPYSQKEYDLMLSTDTWRGGFVSGMGYVYGDVNIMLPGHSTTPKTGEFVTAAQLYAEKNDSDKSGVLNGTTSHLYGPFPSSDGILSIFNTLFGESDIANYFRSHPDGRLYRVVTTFPGNLGATVYKYDYYDENGTLVGTVTNR